jgi:hypothetical protein
MKGKDSDHSQPRLRSRRTRRWVDLPGGTSAMVIAFLNSLASNAISACRRFARKWFASRPLEPLLRGFPAVLAAWPA